MSVNRVILRQDPQSGIIEKENWRKVQEILNQLADNQDGIAKIAGSTSNTASIKRQIEQLNMEFLEHKQDTNNADHQVQHSQTLTAQGTTGDDNTDHDDRYYTAEGTEHPSTNTPWSLRTDIVGLGSGAVSLGADAITTDTSNFDNNLSAADDTVQKALETLDEVSGGGGGSFSTDFYGTMSSGQTLNHNTNTKINFDTATRDVNSEFDAVNKRWVCQTSGTYVFCGIVVFDYNDTGIRITNFIVNGSTPYGVVHAMSGTATGTIRINSIVPVALSAGDYVELWAQQRSGGNLDVWKDGSFFAAFRIQ